MFFMVVIMIYIIRVYFCFVEGGFVIINACSSRCFPDAPLCPLACRKGVRCVHFQLCSFWLDSSCAIVLMTGCAVVFKRVPCSDCAEE